MDKKVLYLGLHLPETECTANVTHLPIIRIVARSFQEIFVQQALREFEFFSHIIITSKTTIPLLHDYLEEFGYKKDCWRNKTTIAIGKKTAKYLEHSGIHSVLIANEETTEGIIELLKTTSLKDSYYFWPHSAQARTVIKDYLQSTNSKHLTCALYDPVPHIPQNLPLLESFDEIVFTSPSTIDAFVVIFGRFPLHAQLRTIGPITEQYLKRLS